MIADYGTHFPYLAGIVSRTTGPVLELGAGHYSTPMLHALCAGRRQLVTLETDPEWAATFAGLQGRGHEIHAVESFSRHLTPANWMPAGAAQPWSVAFVDHHPAPRAESIALLQHLAHYVVVHDVERSEYEPALRAYKYRADFRAYKPWTTIVSDFWPIPEEIA